MSRRRILLLAGTAEATKLATLLAGRGDVDVVASFAGRTTPLAGFPCPVRVGGFGGVDGLVEELRTGGYDALVDASHPFAAQMPHHALTAAQQAGLPRLRLLRPAWPTQPDWLEVADLTGAAQALVETGARRVLLTTGRQDLQPFASLAGMFFVVRSIEAPERLPMAQAVSITARPPFSVEDEGSLLATHHIDTLVTKNSGGADAKLVAARSAAVRVVMVRRPPPVAGPTVSRARDAIEWLDRWRDV